jgi:endonuclease YncB( thermonuclease family)
MPTYREYPVDQAIPHDGDTIHVDVDLGLDEHYRHPLRLLGVNAPELSTPAGKLALVWVKQWLLDNPGPYVLRTNAAREFEKYGRILGTLSSTATGRTINNDLLAASQAVPYLLKG